MESVDTEPDFSISTNIHEMEKLWASELYELSAQDRENTNNELHGVTTSEIHSNPEDGWTEDQYLTCLDLFQTEIDTKIPFEDKQTYRRGLELGSSYIMSPTFRIGFLRAERFDVQKAAIRYCNCLDFLAEFFGEFALMRPLLMSDLTKRESKFLKEGFVQVLPNRDRLGRRILAQLGSYGGDRFTELEKFRVNVYLCFTVLAQDVTTQRLGVVSLGSFGRGAEQCLRDEVRTISNLIKRFFAAIPLRWSAAHLCIPNDPLFHVVKALVLFLIGQNGRRKLRIHIGTPVECDYALRSFGIPTEDIPRTFTHTIKTKNHVRLIKVRKVIDGFVEKAAGTNKDFRFPGIECPEINCVLFGKYAWDHPGNIEFRGLLREVLNDKWLDLDISDQMDSMIEEVIDKSRAREFHFLVYNRETFLYAEVADDEAMRVLADQALKEYRKRRRAKRMIAETKLIITNVADGEDRNNTRGSSNLSSLRRDMGGKKFLKDCNGCRCFAIE